MLPLADHPHQYILLDHDGNAGSRVSNTTSPTAESRPQRVDPSAGTSVRRQELAGDRPDYLLFYRQQLGSNPTWSCNKPAHLQHPGKRAHDVAVVGAFSGLSYGGDVLKETEAVQLDGIIEGYARAGLAPWRSGPPRAIVTFPTMREPGARPRWAASQRFRVGNRRRHHDRSFNAASDIMMAVWMAKLHSVGSCDGATHTDDCVFNTRHTAAGVHTVKVWRTQKDGKTPCRVWGPPLSIS